VRAFSEFLLKTTTPRKIIFETTFCFCSFSNLGNKSVQYFALLCLMDEFVTRISNEIPPFNPSPTLQELSHTPSTSSSVSTNVTTGTPVDLNLLGPSRPKLNSFPKDKNNRCFRSVWYNQFSRLEYSVCKDAAYCYPCRRFLPHTRETGFTIKGYNNWKRAVGDKKKKKVCCNMIQRIHICWQWRSGQSFSDARQAILVYHP